MANAEFLDAAQTMKSQGKKTCNTVAPRSTSSDVNTIAADESAQGFLSLDPSTMVTASLKNRALARVVDGGIKVFAGVVGGLLGAGIGYLLWKAGGPISLVEGGIILGLASGWLAIVATNIYLIALTGQTLGKRRLGIRIVRTDGLPAGFLQGWLLRALPVFGLAVLLGHVMLPGWIAFVADFAFVASKRSRMLHDFAAGTRVINAGHD